MTVDERPRPRADPRAPDPSATPARPAGGRGRGDASEGGPGRGGRSTGAGAPATTRVPARDAAVALLLFALALLWFGQTLDRTFHTTDEGYLLRLGQRVAAGEVPHRDFVEDYGPGVFAALAALVAGGDGEILFVHRALAAWKALAVVLGFYVARLLVPTPVAFGVGLLSIVFWGRASLNVNAPHAALFTIPLCMAAALALASALRREPGARRPGLLAVAGALAGLAVLFKQSLGVMNAYGLTLSILAVAVAGLDAPRAAPTAPDRAARGPWLSVWLVAAALLCVPGWRYLGLGSYLVHLAPIHALMACVAVALWRHAPAPSAAALVRTQALPFVVGGLVPVAGVALYYLASGHLDDLLLGMFERPLRRRNYAIPATLPPASIAVFVIGIGACLAGAGLGVARRRPRAAAALACAGALLAVVALVAIPHANERLYTPKVLARSATIFDWVLHTATLTAAAALFGPALARGGGDPDERRRLRALLPIAFFSATLCFQVFPRGAHNVWLAQAAWMPLLGIVLYEPWRRLAAGLPAPRRAAIAALLLVVPVWLAYPVAARTWRQRDAPTRALALPKTRGLSVRVSSVERWHVADLEALVAELGRRPDGPLLLFGGDVMLHYVTDRPPLRPEHEYALYNVVLDMLPLRELAALEDGGWVPRLQAEPTAAVVVVHDDAGARVRAALPTLDAWVRSHYRPTMRFGPYELWEPAAPPADPATRPARRAPR